MSETSEKRKSTTRPLLIAANRTSVTIKHLGDGRYEYSSGSGGLVTALHALKESQSLLWYGNPGKIVPDDDLTQVETEIRARGAVPVWIDAQLMDLYYNKFSSESFFVAW